jgi:NAD(P)-dependent dehydrogenase (short-subunit alcohol dehydrogenase family)
MPNVLVTGSSAGFGRVIVVELGRRGFDVFATMRSLERRAALDAAAAQAGVSARVHVSQLDVTDAASIAAAVPGILSAGGGRLDAVVHNAGVAAAGAFEDLPEPELRRVMETNFFGVLALTRALLPSFRAQRSGRIVIVSSDSAFAGEPGNSIYVASKWAVEGWAESLAYEISPFGIDVVLVEPGPYRTEIWRTTPRILPEGTAYRPYLERLERAVDERVRRFARDPQEVALAIAGALEARRPRFRYPVGPESHVGLLLRGVVPARLRRRLVTRLLGLHRVRL